MKLDLNKNLTLLQKEAKKKKLSYGWKQIYSSKKVPKSLLHSIK